MTLQFNSVDQALRKAKTLTKQGAIGEAREAYQWVLENFPGNKRAQDGLKTLGSRQAANGNAGLTQEQANALIALFKQGRMAEALQKGQAMAAVYPDAAFLHNFTGLCHAALRQPNEAIARYQRALQLTPEAADIHASMGDALGALGRLDEAAGSYRRAIELNPGLVNAHNNLGSALMKLGDVQGAADAYGNAAKVDPACVDAYSNLGLALIKLGDLRGGGDACRRAIELKPDFALAHVNLAHAQDSLGENEEAIASLEKAIALKPDHAGAHSNLCELLDRLNRVDELRAAVARALEHCDANDPRLLFRAAQLASRDGDHQAARDMMERMPEEGLTPAIAKRRLTLLGKTCDKLGDYPAAFDWFERANGYVKASPSARGWSPESYRDEIAAMATSFESASGAPWTDAPEPERAAPVFLVGFPRSGTTLLDTILRSHPDIAVLEELPMVDRMRTHLGGTIDRERLASLGEDEIAALRQIYFDELDQHLGETGGAKVIVDKLPLNIVSAGLIRRVFPSAKFIFAQRHPCDCVLSCLMQNFTLNNAMANFLDLENSAMLYDRVMRLWEAYRTALKLDVHTLVYEDLVGDLKGTVTPLLSFLGLDWDDKLEDYRETALARGRIYTPSYNQVTEQLYDRAAGRWEHYREQLAPALPLLEPWAKRFGY